MYQLRVIHPGSVFPVETVQLDRPGDVLTTIPALLARHAECQRLEVLAGATFLFAVSCSGERLDG